MDIEMDIKTENSEHKNYKTFDENGLLHSKNDEPAFIINHVFGIEKRWYKNGKIHRDGDLPAIIRDNGTSFYYIKEGKLHREGNKPAIERWNGEKYYIEHGKQLKYEYLPIKYF